MDAASDPTRRQVRAYGVYLVLRESYPWMPVFFLYFNAHLSLGQVLWLEAIYYASVVALEVPSGYASDRLGRRPTLIASSAMLQSLAGRLAFAGLLAALALTTPEGSGDLTWPALSSRALLAGAILGALALPLLAWRPGLEPGPSR